MFIKMQAGYLSVQLAQTMGDMVNNDGTEKMTNPYRTETLNLQKLD